MPSRHWIVPGLLAAVLLVGCAAPANTTAKSTAKSESDPMVTDEVPLITRQELQKRMADKSIIVVDTLPAEMHANSRIPGSVNIPGFPYQDAIGVTDNLAPKLLPDKNKPLALYCINPPCRNSEFVGRELIRLGYTQVAKYAEGIDDWTRGGLPLEGRGR